MRAGCEAPSSRLDPRGRSFSVHPKPRRRTKPRRRKTDDCSSQMDVVLEHEAREGTGMMEDCDFPRLSRKYDTALREAASFVLRSFKPVGIIASGTIVRGNPDATSDLDLWVVHLEPTRQRIQKFFNAVPAEIFVNPPWTIRSYFARDQADARPIAAHMMATGHVVLATHPIVGELRQRAQWLLTQPPDLTDEAIARARYEAATHFEDATDLVSRDPIGASLLLSQSLVKMMRFAFMNTRTFVPRDKDLLDEFGRFAVHSAAKVGRFFQTVDLGERVRLATEIADDILGVRGFFEWSSSVEINEAPTDGAA
jgi:predicted nucleotidyltransferase